MKNKLFFRVALVMLVAMFTFGQLSAQDDTFVIATGTDIENANIHAVTSSPSFTVLAHVNETLFTMTVDGVLEPLLAESIDSSDDTTYVITLKEGISFTDGTPFNAEAVKANLEWVLDVDNAAAFRSLLVVGGEEPEINVIDDYTLEIITAAPFAPLPAHLSHDALAIVSPALIEQGADAMATTTIGTGPYVLAQWDRAEQVVLTRNEDYWGEAAATGTVIFKVVAEDGARLVEIEAGTVDVAMRVPPAEIPRLEMDPNIDVVVTPGLRTIYVFFNVTNPPFDDVRVRQAVNYAVDNDAIVASLFENAAIPSLAPFASPIFGYAEQTPYTRDVEKARELLAEAGIEEGTTVVLYHPTARYSQDALVADAIRSQLREVGLEVELRTLEWTQYPSYVRRPAEENDIQFAMLGWGTPTMDADYALYGLFHSSQVPPGFNGSFYANPDVDALLDAARSTLDADERQALYAEAIGTIWEDAPWLFLYSEIQVTAVRNNVEGFVVHPDESVIVTDAVKN